MAATDSPSGAALAALTAAALALPGLAPVARADSPPQGALVDTNFSRYEENAGRMRVDIYQAALTVPVGDRLSLRFNGVKDVVSGASPVGVGRGRYGYGQRSEPLSLVMSGASIFDVRDEVDIGLNYYLDEATLGVNVGKSNENDYSSDFFNLDGRFELNDKATTLAAGYGYASDTVWEIVDVDGQKTKAPGVGGDKDTHQAMLGVTQVLDKNSLAQLNLTYTHSNGFLSDPYKYALVDGYSNDYFPDFVRDSRPGYRDQFAVLLRYVRNFSALNAAALHLDYRFYADTWGIDAHTFELSWIQPIAYGFELRPRLRYYTQGSADFYQPTYDAPRADGLYSSDYRLAGFGALSGGVQLSTEVLGRLRVAGGVDFYQRRQDYGISGGAGTSVDDYSFSMYSVSLNLKF